ncbi:MAG: hypothetical protein KDC13_06955, partial [Bacteroidetes bacterium]|nr:hypothetical protein [Bacteroidota bacterium]
MMDFNYNNLRYIIHILVCVCLYSNPLTGQSASKNLSWTQVLWVDPMEIGLSVVYEGEINVDGENISSYSISWNDTLGAAANFPSYNRPYELKAVVRDKDSIVGKYTGLSTQMSHCMILTNSKFVELFFWVDLNIFFSNNQKRNGQEHPINEGDSMLPRPPLI